MASSERHGLDKMGNGCGVKTGGVGESKECDRKQSNGANNDGGGGCDDDDTDNECWDDAKALLQNNYSEDDEDAADGSNHRMVDNSRVVVVGRDDGPAGDKFRDDFGDPRSSFNSINTSQLKQIPSSSSSSPQDTVDGLFTSKLHQPTSSSSAYSSTRSDKTPPHLPSAAPSASKRTTQTVESKPTSSIAVSSSSSATPDDLILHEAVFNNDLEKVLAILNDTELIKRNDLVNKRDKHGNTALHLACMMGRPKTIINAMLHNQHGLKWNIDTKNVKRWTPFHEACSYGNREIIALMANQLRDDVDEALHNSKLTDFLTKSKDYRLVLRWEFQSWIPFVTHIMPSDVCVITKQGKFVRIDTRLVNFDGFFSRKGDGCLLYSNNRWILMDNKSKKYQYFDTVSVYKEMDDKVDEFMTTDIMDIEFKSSQMQLTPSTSGWIWKANKVGKVGRFNAALYDLNNVSLVTRKRREHLTEDDLKRNKNTYKSAVHVFKYGERRAAASSSTSSAAAASQTTDDQREDEEDEEEEVEHRESLPPPPPTKVTWQEYLDAEAGKYPTLGREQKCKEVKVPIKASVAMSEDFPLSKGEFLDLLSIVPLKMFKKLKEFVQMKLPEGFPVRLDIPVFPFLTARITFEDFAFHEGPINESLFCIPQDYKLDKNLMYGSRANQTNNGSDNNNNNNDNNDAANISDPNNINNLIDT